MRKTLIASMFGMCVAQQSAAFSPDDDIRAVLPLGPLCSVYTTLDSVTYGGSGAGGSAGFAEVTIENLLLRTSATAGGSWYGSSGGLGSATPISAQFIARCLSTDASNISDFEQNGADSTYENDTYIGFSFTLNESSAALAAGSYEYFVSGSRVLPNQTPTANAGTDQSVASATAPVTLDGSASTDPDVDQSLTYAWTAPAGITLSDATAASPTFTAPTLAAGDEDATLTFSLTVTDSLGLASTADTVTVTVAAPTLTNSAPTANAGTDQSVASATAPVTLDGSASTDPDVDQSLTYAWTAPAGITLSDATAASPTFTAPTLAAGDEDATLTFSLTVTDSLGLASTADTVTVTVTAESGPTIEEIQTEIATYMQNRASLVIASQPDLIGLLSGNVAGAFNAQVTQGNGAFDFATTGNQPVWARIQGNWSKSGDNDNSYFFGVVGAHANLTPDAIAGVMLQFDKLTQTNSETTIEGDGYLIGPYFVAKLPDQPLYFEGRYLLGQTDNSLSIDGATAQEFETDRSLLSLKVAGQLNYGDLALTPTLSATRLEDSQNAFTDNAGRAVAEQGVTVTDIVVGLDFSKPVSLSTGTLVLTGGFASVWSETQGDGFASTITPDFDGRRGRVHLGTAYTLENGAILSAGTSYDGIGMDDYEIWGLSLGLEMKF